MKKNIIIVFFLMMNAFLYSNNNATTDVKEINSSQVKEMLFGNTKNNVDYKFNGLISNMAYSKNTGSLVVAEMDKTSLNLYFFKNDGKLKWKKNITNISRCPYVYISDNSEIIVLNYIVESVDDFNAIYKTLILDKNGFILSEKKSYNIYNVSPNGKYVYTFCPNEIEPSNNIEIYDTSFKKISINGFKKDESFIIFTFLTDTLIYVERAYIDNVFSYDQNKDIVKTEFYSFSNNNMKILKSYLNFEKNIQLCFFNVRLFNDKIQIIDSQVYDFQKGIVYDLSGNIINKYEGYQLCASENDGLILEKKDNDSGLKLIKKNKSEIFIEGNNNTKLKWNFFNFSIYYSYIIISSKKDLTMINKSSLYNQLTKTFYSFKGRIIIDQNRFMILTEKKIIFGEIK